MEDLLTMRKVSTPWTRELVLRSVQFHQGWRPYFIAFGWFFTLALIALAVCIGFGRDVGRTGLYVIAGITIVLHVLYIRNFLSIRRKLLHDIVAIPQDERYVGFTEAFVRLEYTLGTFDFPWEQVRMIYRYRDLWKFDFGEFQIGIPPEDIDEETVEFIERICWTRGIRYWIDGNLFDEPVKEGELQTRVPWQPWFSVVWFVAVLSAIAGLVVAAKIFEPGSRHVLRSAIVQAESFETFPLLVSDGDRITVRVNVANDAPVDVFIGRDPVLDARGKLRSAGLPLIHKTKVINLETTAVWTGPGPATIVITAGAQVGLLNLDIEAKAP